MSKFFRVAAINENGSAPRGVAAIDITPPVSHHPGPSQVYAELLCRFSQHTGFWLPAVALRFPAPGVVTDLNMVNRQLRTHAAVDCLDHFPRKRAASHIRLVCGNHKDITRVLELAASLGDFGQDDEFFEAGWRVWLAIPLERAVDHAVAIEKNGPRFRATPAFSGIGVQRVLSHFVCPTFNRG